MKTRKIGEIARNKYWREPEARVVIEAWQRSGESLAGFSKRHGIRSRRLSWWSKRLEKPVRRQKARSVTPKTEPMVLHPVRVVDRPERTRADAVTARIEIEFPDGVRVRVPAGCAADELRLVLVAVQEAGSC